MAQRPKTNMFTVATSVAATSVFLFGVAPRSSDPPAEGSPWLLSQALTLGGAVLFAMGGYGIAQWASMSQPGPARAVGRLAAALLWLAVIALPLARIVN